MKKEGWIGFLIGIVFGLLMVMPSFVHADVTVSGGTESSMVDLEGINNGSVTPGTFTTQSGTTRNAYITDTGSVNTTDNAAILTNANGWSVNVSELGSLTGNAYGVWFDDDGNNPYLNGTLTNYGSIFGGNGGVEMNYGTITNYGSLMAGIGSGAIFWSEGTGTATVTNSGTMSGGDDGLSLYNPSTGTMTAVITNNTGGTMTGYYNGIDFYSAGAGIVTVTNSGSITGTDDGDGIYLYSDGALTARIQNNFGGTIDGYYDGIHFESGGAGAATITNAGTITGDWGNGVYLWSDGAGTFAVNNSGSIASYDEYSSGLYIGSGIGTGTATVTNSGTISAYGDGIGIEYLDSATVTNNTGGRIESDWCNGLFIYDVGTVNVNNIGTIASYDDDDNRNHSAIYIHGVAGTATVNNNAGGNIQAVNGEGVYIGYANTAMINNYGTIQSSDSEGVHTDEAETVTVNNYAGGLIQSDDSGEGIYIEDAVTATVNNYGKINGVCETGVYIDGVGTATLNNYAGGLILGEEEEAIEIYADTVTVNNYGRIEGYDEAVYIEDAMTATVNNTGTIVSYDSDGIYYDGNDINSVGTVQVTNSGTINADDDGVYIEYADTVTVNNNAGGSIQAHDDGVAIYYVDTATVNNSGTITTNGWDYYDEDADDAYGINIQYADTATVTNSGTINAYGGDSEGYYSSYSDGGYADSGGAYGIFMYEVAGTATVTNSGTINAYGGAGYGGDGGMGDGYYGGDGYGGFEAEGVDIEFVNTATVTNSGTINAHGGDGYGGDGGMGDGYYGGDGGDGYGSYGDGIYIDEVAGTATVTNSGTISGYGGSAYGGDGGDTFDDYYGGDGGDAYAYDYESEDYSGSGIWIEDVATATVTNNVGGIISGDGGDAYGGDGGDASYDGDGDGGNGGDAYGSDAYGIYIENVGGTKTATVNNLGAINAYGGDAYGGEGGTGDDNGGNGGDAYGGDAYGIFIEEVAGTATVTNSGTINATGGDAYGGNGGDGYYGGDGGYGDGGDAYGINIQYAGTATVTNSGTINATGGYYYSGDGGTGDENGGEGGYGHGGNAYGIYMYEIGGEETATVNNSGTINAYGGYAYGGEGGDGYYGGDGSRGYGGDAFGVYIYNAITATMTNSGTINAYGGDAYGGDGGEAYSWGGDGDDAYGGDAFGIYIGNVDTATVTNSGTINAYGGDAYGGDGAYSYDYDSGYGDDAYGGDAYGVYIYEVGGVDTATMTNSGAINAYGGDAYGGDSVDYDYDGGDAYGGDAYGIYIYEALTATVTNNISGTINGDGGDAYAGYGDRDGDAYGGYGYGIYIADAGTATVDNYGTINAYGGTAYDGDYNYGGDGTGVYIANVETTTVNNSGTINGYRGSGDDPYSYGFGVRIQNVDTAEVSNKAGGTINGDDFGVLIQGANERTVTNENGGTISGEVGIGTGVGGSTRIFNYGKIESTDGMSGRAIVVRGYDNQVTLGTGTEIIGNIVAVNSDEDNLMFLDGQGTIYADQMRGFASLEKTGAGTWTLTGDMDYNSYYSGHSIYVEEGVLALSTSSGVGNGVVTDSFTQTDGSLGYEVTATGYTGRMTVNGDADFNNGTIIVIPLAGTYAEETRYANVLTADSTTNQWTGVVSTSAFLSPSMADAAVYGGSGESYDLILERLSFTTAATESANGLAAALDGMYDTATGDLRILLDELIVMSPDVAQTGLSQLSGGTHTAFQLMSFNGIGRYLGVLNNHMSGGSGFAFDKQSSGFAWNSGMQMAMAGGGNSMSDAMPMMLAMAGNVSGQSQIASGTNWGIWADGYFSKGNRRSDELISEYDQTLFGGMIGFDFRIANNLFMGISAGISNTELDFDNLPDEGEMNSYHGSLYLCYDGKPWYALGIMTYAYNDYDLDRYITTLGPTVIAKSDYSGKEYVGYAELGYKLNAGGVTIRPLVAFQVDYLDQESFEETGAGIYNLAVDDNGTGSYQSFLGVNISGDIKMGASASLKPELRLKWAHEFSNDDHLINAQLAGGGGSFTVEAETLSRDTAIVGAGLTLMFNKNVSAYVQYDAELNSDFINHTGLVGLRLAW